MKVFVIGAGRWGSFIGWYLDSIGHTVSIYGREGSENFAKLRESRDNGLITFRESINFTSELKEAHSADVIIISIGSQGLAALIDSLKGKDLKNKTVVLCMKGVEIATGRRLSEIAEEGLDKSNKVAVWLGPGHVQDFAAGIPNCMVIDSRDDETKKSLVEAFQSNLIRFYYGTDLIGNEIGAAAKNVIGIAAGILDGLGLSSLKGALMARGPREISRLAEKMGADPMTVYGLCHVGDYEATLFSPHSHNRAFGEALARGEKYEALAEGYYTVKALLALGEKYSCELPICRAVYEIAYENKDAGKTLSALFARSIKYEF